MSSVQIHTEHTERLLYVITSANEKVSCFGMILKHPVGSHKCAYVSVDKSILTQAQAAIDKVCPISYMGIGSALINVPDKVYDMIDIGHHGYWLGIDFKDFPIQPTDIEVELKMEDIVNVYSLFV